MIQIQAALCFFWNGLQGIVGWRNLQPLEVTIMDDDTRSKLIDIGAESLADALLEMASRHDDAAEMVGRLLASPEGNLRRFQDNLEGLASLTDRRHFIDWRYTAEYAMDCCDLLQDLEAANPDPRTGVENVAAFFSAFGPIIEACDDSSGHVSGVFRFDATDHFVGYAQRCEDSEFLEETVVRLCGEDKYGITDYLVGRAPEYLPRNSLLRLADRFKAAAKAEPRKENRWSLFAALEALAAHLGDPDLVTWCRRTRSSRLTAADHIDIGEAHLEAGDAEKALEWLRKSTGRNSFEESRREALLMTALERVGDAAGATELAWMRFRRHRSDHTLADLLALIGEGERERVVEEGWELIRAEPDFLLSDLVFLVEHDRLDDAASYVATRADQLDGSRWETMTPIAGAFNAAGHALAAILVYRALLDSILARGFTKAYGYGAGYLATLERLAGSVADWQGSPTHEDYVAKIREAHGRKRSFWKRVEEGG